MILVTGGTGLLGAHLLYELTKGEAPIRAIYREYSRVDRVKQLFFNHVDAPSFDHIEWVQADLLDIPALTEAFKDVSQVYHCAALVSFDPQKYHALRRINIEGTANVVNIAIAAKVKKLCHVSSIAALGSSTDTTTIDEGTCNTMESIQGGYGISKYGAEMEVWRGTQEGLKAVIVNPGVILGGGIWECGTGSLFRKAHEGIPFFTKGCVGLIAVDDVVKIMLQLMTQNIINERFVLVAETWSYERFLHHLSLSVKSSPPQKNVGPLVLRIACCFDQLKHLITGRPRVLTKDLIRSLFSKNDYSSKKIEELLNYEFISIENTIERLGAAFLNSD